MEHPLHQLPLLIRRGVGVAALEAGYVCLPLALAWQSGHARHGRVPLEVERSLHYHGQYVAVDIDLHLEDTYLADSIQDLLPYILLGMAFPIELNQLRIVAD